MSKSTRDENYLGYMITPYGTVRLWDANYFNGSHSLIDGTFTTKTGVVFDFVNMGCPLSYAVNSKMAFIMAAFWVSVKPGDTDPEYFEKYTEAQLEWAEKYGEELSSWCCEQKEKLNRGRR